MKAIVTVTRTSYSTKDIEVEIPDAVYKTMSSEDRRTAFKEKAVEKAGNHVFTEDSSDYEVDFVKIL